MSKTRSFTRSVVLFLMVLSCVWGLSFELVSANVIPGPKTGSELSAQVPPTQDGTTKDRIVRWEQECTTDLRDERDNPAWGGNEREIVNAAAYNETTWLSQQGNPNLTLSNNIPHGTTSINMQINQILFLCAIVTMDASGSDRITTENKVSDNRYPNDRRPVPNEARYSPNQASRYEHNTRVYSISAQSGGSVSNLASNALGYRRENNSRYWIADPVAFRYNLPPALQTPGQHELVIRANIASISTYHEYGGAGTSRCVLRSTGRAGNVNYNNFDRCERENINYRFRYTILQPVIISCVPGNGVTAISGNETGAPLSFRMRVNSTGSTPPTPRNFVYTVRNAAGSVVQTSSVSADASNVGLSAPVSITPTSSGRHTVTWSYTAGGATRASNCSGFFDVYSKPYFRVYNGDVRAGGGFGPGCSSLGAGNIYAFNNQVAGAGNAGAGVQVAAFAAGIINQFVSASTRTSAPLPLKGLTFANTGTGAAGSLYGGGFGTSCTPDYWAEMPDGYTPPNSLMITSPALPAVLSGPGISAAGSTINFGPGAKKTVYVNGDVYINANIAYAGSWGSPNEIPSFHLIVRGNIYVDDGVSRLDGTYIALPTAPNTKGIIYSCATSATAPNAGEIANSCNTNRLTVNGSFIARQVKLLRTLNTVRNATAGEGVGGGAAAEVFNFNPSIWMAQDQNTSAAGQYDSITSLPPVL